MMGFPSGFGSLLKLHSNVVHHHRLSSSNIVFHHRIRTAVSDIKHTSSTFLGLLSGGTDSPSIYTHHLVSSYPRVSRVRITLHIYSSHNHRLSSLSTTPHRSIPSQTIINHRDACRSSSLPTSTMSWSTT